MANYDKIVVTLLLFCVIKFFPVCVKQVPWYKKVSRNKNFLRYNNGEIQ